MGEEGRQRRVTGRAQQHAAGALPRGLGEELAQHQRAPGTGVTGYQDITPERDPAADIGKGLVRDTQERRAVESCVHPHTI
ncbi:hypothetical protein Cde04nite_01480 [Cellulomonas denverensis]|nr:hypothetical protein Cde04nite_01480 [Cellulomonas denverensis]